MLMINNDKLEEYRKTIQSIIDRILPEDERFSVKDFDEEWLYYISSLFLEKDYKKRKKIYNEIRLKILKTEERLKQVECDFLEFDNEIFVKKNEYDKIFNTIKELRSLVEDINIEEELDSELNQF